MLGSGLAPLPNETVDCMSRHRAGVQRASAACVCCLNVVWRLFAGSSVVVGCCRVSSGGCANA
eukprot:313529-Lingulodinium_polyedra.AAC.1